VAGGAGRGNSPGFLHRGGTADCGARWCTVPVRTDPVRVRILARTATEAQTSPLAEAQASPPREAHSCPRMLGGDPLQIPVEEEGPRVAL